MTIQKPFMGAPRCANNLGHQIRRSKQGYVLILSVLVLGAVGIMIAASVLLFGVGSSRSAFALERSVQARSLANACIEEALQQIKDSTSYSGSEEILLGEGLCEYNVVNEGGKNRTITAMGTVGTIVRKVRVTIDKINPIIHVTSWEEVSDY